MVGRGKRRRGCGLIIGNNIQVNSLTCNETQPFHIEWFDPLTLDACSSHTVPLYETLRAYLGCNSQKTRKFGQILDRLRGGNRFQFCNAIYREKVNRLA